MSSDAPLILSPADVAERVTRACARLAGVRVAVCGDLLLDEYIWGEAERISPEAPVPVVRVTRQAVRLGGAANVALGIAVLGGEPELVGRIGADETGRELVGLWSQAGFSAAGLIPEARHTTPRKTRILAAGQQMLRLDREAERPATGLDPHPVAAALRKAIANAGACCFSDYQKGMFTPDSIPLLVEAAGPNARPVLANPKPASAQGFGALRLQSVNRREALGLLPAEAREEGPDTIGPALARRLGVQTLVITQGAGGMTAYDAAGGRLHVPAVASEVFDVTGAGDTVLAALTLAAGAGCSVLEGLLVATYAAGVVVRKVGVAAASPAEITQLAQASPVAPELQGTFSVLARG